MHASGLNSEDRFSLLFCHACLSSNRTLTMVGDYVDIYLKICDNVRMNVTSQVSLCWECITMLKKIYAFKKKVENAQKILDYCVKNQASLPGLTYLTQSETETTTFPMDVHETEEYYEDLERTNIRQLEDGKDELMIRIEDVRGHYEIEKPDLSFNSSFGCDVTVNVDSLSPVHEEDELDHRRWKRTVLIVCKSICGHRHAHHFLRPVSDELAPLYSRVIRRPTDLGTIRKQINKGVIRTTPQLERALLLMFSNALMYNSTHHDMIHMALELRAETLRELSVLSESESPAGRSLRRAPAPAPRPAPEPGPQPPPAPRAPRRRRASLWTEPRRDLHETHTQPLNDSNPRLDPPAAKVRRRRHTERQPAPPPPPPPPRAPRRRRASLWTEPQRDQHQTDAQPLNDSNPRLDPPAAKVRRRRHTERQPAPPPPPPPPRAPRRRRASLWTEPQRDQHQTDAQPLNDSNPRLDPPAAKVRRRRHTERQPAPPPPPPPPRAPRRRRASLWTEPQRDQHQTDAQPLNDSNARLDPPAAKVRRRRHTERQPAPPPPPSAPPAPAPPPPPPRAWVWTPLDLDTELLEPRHFSKKCKAVLL